MKIGLKCHGNNTNDIAPEVKPTLKIGACGIRDRQHPFAGTVRPLAFDGGISSFFVQPYTIT